MLPGRVAASSSAAMARTSARGSWIGSTPFWKQLLKKIGPKEGAMTQRTPMPIIAHTAPSRLEPQAKLLSATTISAPLKARLVEEELRIVAAVGQVAPRLEGVGAEIGLRHVAQAVDGDDDVGVDVLPHQRRRLGVENGEGLHVLLSF